MDDGNKKEFVIDGLNCSSCAIDIENSVKNIKGIDEARINLMTKTMIINTKKSVDFEQMFYEIKKIIKSHEPNVDIKEKNIKKEDERAVGKRFKIYNFLFSIGMILFLINILLKQYFYVELTIYIMAYFLIDIMFIKGCEEYFTRKNF